MSEQSQHLVIVVGGVEDGLSVVATGDDVVQPAFDFDSQFPRHKASMLIEERSSMQKELQNYMPDPESA